MSKKNPRKEKYWVTSNGDEPVQIFFTEAQAILSDMLFVDAFDEDGYKVRSLKRISGCNYTADF